MDYFSPGAALTVGLCLCLSAGLPDGERLRQPGASGDDHAGGGRGRGQHLQETQRGRCKISAASHSDPHSLTYQASVSECICEGAACVQKLFNLI